MRLVYDSNNKPVKVGDSVLNFRRDRAKVVAIEEPRSPQSTGRIHVRFAGSEWDSAFYPSVFNMHWEGRQD